MVLYFLNDNEDPKIYTNMEDIPRDQLITMDTNPLIHSSLELEIPYPTKLSEDDQLYDNYPPSRISLVDHDLYISFQYIDYQLCVIKVALYIEPGEEYILVTSEYDIDQANRFRSSHNRSITHFNDIEYLKYIKTTGEDGYSGIKIPSDNIYLKTADDPTAVFEGVKYYDEVLDGILGSTGVAEFKELLVREALEKLGMPLYTKLNNVYIQHSKTENLT